MTAGENRDFIEKVESLVNPKDITAISFLGDFNKYLPKKTQDKIIKKGSSKVPYMGFIVDPYCLFLAYEIKDTKAAEKMLPEGYELAKARVFKDEAEKYLAIISAFTARTSAFMGMRLECYIIARSKKTGMMSWIIADYETNTNSHDPKNGYGGYSCGRAVFAAAHNGTLIINVSSTKNSTEFSVSAELEAGSMEALDEALWIEGNMSIDYGGTVKDASSSAFSLIFDPGLMSLAKKMPLDKLTIKVNTCLSGLIEADKPVSAALFPYSQHFVIRQDLPAAQLKNTDSLLEQLKIFLERKDFKQMSGDDIKKPLFKSMLISAFINWAIIIFLLIKVLF
jgi:hypothetical protein